MGAQVAGRNGLIYISGNEIVYANTWEVGVAQGAVGGAYFGQGWTVNEAGIKDWSGSVTAWFDQDSQQLYTAATAGATVAVLIYPKRTDLTTYWKGDAIFTTFRASGAVDGMITHTADMVGSGSLSNTGFS